MARGHFKCHLVIVVIIFSFEKGRSGGGGERRTGGLCAPKE
jgi:hypothetical protein